MWLWLWMLSGVQTGHSDIHDSLYEDIVPKCAPDRDSPNSGRPNPSHMPVRPLHTRRSHSFTYSGLTLSHTPVSPHHTLRFRAHRTGWSHPPHTGRSHALTPRSVSLAHPGLTPSHTPVGTTRTPRPPHSHSPVSPHHRHRIPPFTDTGFLPHRTPFFSLVMPRSPLPHTRRSYAMLSNSP